MTKDIKIEVTSLFTYKWTATTVHYNGLDFNIDDKEEWIYVSYEPIAASPSGIGFDGYREDGVIKITVHSRKENRTFELLDLLLEMFRTNKIGTMIMYNNKVGSKGVMSTSNGDYRYLNCSIYIKNY